MLDIVAASIMVASTVIIAVLRVYETWVFTPIMGRGFRLRGE